MSTFKQNDWLVGAARTTSHYKTYQVDSLKVSEHVSSTEQHGCRVGDVPSYSLCKGVTCTLKEKRETNAGLVS